MGGEREDRQRLSGERVSTKPRRPTMKDVALHAGVSVSTVSYVLNESGPVAPERRSRVLDAIRILDYTPNESARSLKRQSASTIGLVLPELSNQFFALVAEGVERAASARDVLVVMVVPEVTEQPEPHHAKLLRSQRLDGVIYLSGATTSPREVLELARSGPVVLVDEHLAGSGLPAIVSDSRRGAREVTQLVLEHGHRRLAVIGGPPALWTAQQRLAGYREAAAAAGLDPDDLEVFDGDYRQSSGFALAAEALSGPADERPTALLCANDMMAVGAMLHCREAGLRVPGDVSIVGFDDVPFVSMLTPSLTTVRQSAGDMGVRAISLLFDVLAGRPSEDPLQVMPVTVRVRESVAPPSA